MKKILFIEDESALQKAVSDTLTEHGYEVVQALDGEIGIRLAHDKQPDLILLDLVLPKKNGFEVLTEIKKDPSIQNIPVIILTNLEGTEEVEKAVALGATKFLIKANYSLDEILKKIEETIA